MSQHLHSDFKIRLPDELKEKIRHSANELNRSMTADIVARLEQSFEDKPELVPASSYQALYEEYKINQKLLREISAAVLSLKESADGNTKPSH